MSGRDRRGTTAPRLAVIWWRDIPTQVVAQHGPDTVRAQLPDRFLQAVDRAAMRAGLTGTDAYLDQWSRRTRPCGTDLRAEVAAEVAALDQQYPSAELTRLVRATPTPEGASR